MSYSSHEILLVTVIYLIVIFAVAYFFENRRDRLLSKTLYPYIYALSLAVYCTSWTFYGSVGRAATSGLSFLTIYIGPTLMVALFPLFFTKVIRIARQNGITSISDFLGLRYGRSMWLSRIVTLIAVIGITPYISLQIKAVIATMGIIANKSPETFSGAWEGLVITLILGLFASVFGARRIDPSERHTGLVYAIAFESVIKLLAFLSVGLFVTYYFFGGLNHLLVGIRDAGLSHLLRIGGDSPTSYSEWCVLLLLSMLAIVLLPRQFQMAVVENSSIGHVRTALWLFPLYLLVINLFVVPIAFAGLLKGIDPKMSDYYVLTLPLYEGFPVLGLIAFIGGFSAATAMVIVEAIALSTMVMNSLIIPVVLKRLSHNRYLSTVILNTKRALIIAIVFMGYIFAVTFGELFTLVDLGLKSFEAVSIFAPAFFAAIYWKRANKYGAIAGIIGGFMVWLYTLILPAFMKAGLIDPSGSIYRIATSKVLNPSALFGLEGLGKWEHSFFWSMLVNLSLFVGLSLLTKQSEEEQVQSLVFVESYQKALPSEGLQTQQSPFGLMDIENTLSHYIGYEETKKAIGEFLLRQGLSKDRLKPTDLLRIRQEAEKILSASIGPVLASLILEQRLLLTEAQRQRLYEEVRQITENIRLSRQELAEKNRELLSLKEFTEKIIESAPVGIASVDAHYNVLYWSSSMEAITGISTKDARSQGLPSLLNWFDAQWFKEVSRRNGAVRHSDGKVLQYSINPLKDPLEGYIVILEDITERRKMEEELLHSAKLASIGRLTAGLSHEIGNPIASISSLVQELSQMDMNSEDDRLFLKRAIEDISSHIYRINGIVKSLGKFAKISTIEKTESDLADLFEKTLALVRFDPRFKEVVVEERIKATSPVLVNTDQIQQLFMNLLLNALDAMPNGGRILVEKFEEGDWVVFRLTDNGIGMDDNTLKRIFDPFYTTKPPGKGTGLGLSICYGIVKNHKGTIEVSSRLGEGTTFEVRFPVGS